MKLRIVLLAAVGAALVACQGGSDAQRNFGVAREALDGGCDCLVIPPAPPITNRINLDDYPWGTPLYPRGTETAYTVFIPHPYDSTRFIVYGFNPKRGTMVFYGVGTIRASYGYTLQQITRDTVALRNSLLPDFNSGSTGQVDPGPSGPPIGPVIDQWAWQTAYKNWQAERELMSVGNTTTTTLSR